MKRENLILAFLILATLSCQSKELRSKNKGQSSLTQSVAQRTKEAINDQKSNKVLSVIDTVVNDGFIARTLNNDLKISNILSAYNPISQQIQTATNSHDSSLTDTTKTLTKGTDSFSFLTASGKSILTSAIIQSNTITLDGNIVIGASKSVFASKFSVAQVSDNFVVNDLESGNRFIFTFNTSGNLVKIEYQILYLE